MSHTHTHDLAQTDTLSKYIPAFAASILLLVGIVADTMQISWFSSYIRFGFYLIPYFVIGLEVINKAWRSIFRHDYFNEFMLMSIATIGAFCIQEYPEAVAVMLFYQIGELFQDAAVQRAKKSIKALLDIRPDIVTVKRNDYLMEINPADVAIGEVILIKPGEKVALDGILISEKSAFNTSALTGESKPDNKYKGEKVLAGMINLNTITEITVDSLFKDSKLSKILEMVQEATTRKANTQLFISRFAKIYTPVVVALASLIIILPYLYFTFYYENNGHYIFNHWLYRALVFLVISCPCALVVSIPLGYFGGIGLGSKNGILFKGSNYLDAVTEIDTVVMDKTGTLTKGVFKVQNVEAVGIDKDTLLKYVIALERHSTHPIAKAIVDFGAQYADESIEINLEEIPGHGLRGRIGSREILAGNIKLLKKFNVVYNKSIEDISDTLVVVAIDEIFEGYITIADEVKEDAKSAIQMLQKMGIHTVMLSGDKQAVVNSVATKLSLHEAYGDLLPEDKVQKVQILKDVGKNLAFVGDGVNDAPVIALANVGIAMGGLGSDATIETADIVIQNDQPSKVATAILIGKKTKQIVWQNISMAFSVKVVVLILGAGGLATLWEAVFADVGVALLAILNAIKIQNSNI